jgi:cytochrome bd-type quinol oxidase subunit 2
LAAANVLSVSIINIMKNLCFTVLLSLPGIAALAQDSTATLQDRSAAETGSEVWMWIVGGIALLVLIVIITRGKNNSRNDNINGSDRLKRPKSTDQNQFKS